MNPLFEELLAQAPGQTPVMSAAPTVASTGGTVEQPLTPAGHALAGGILHGLMFPGKAAMGEAQVFDDQGHTTDEAVNWGVDRALGMVGKSMIPKTPVAPNELAFGSGPIRAYHGSPHDFDRFDLSKIGTGEGAQAYGHGLYFAEQEGVAKAYRDALAGKNAKYNGAAPSWDDPLHVATAWTNNFGGDTNQALRYLKRGDLQDPAIAGAIKLLEEGAPLAQRTATPGRMYEVAIHADPERFLDWDKPLSAQPQVMKKLGLSSMSEDAINQEALRLMTQGNEAAGRAGGWMDNPHLKSRIDQLQSEYDRLPREGVTGEHFYRNTSPDDYLHSLMSSSQAGLAAGRSRELLDAGIPGIKYLDQGSRAAGDGSRNFVTFSDKIVEIMRKYGVASFAALPPAVQMMLQRGQTETPAGNGGLGGLGGLAPRA